MNNANITIIIVVIMHYSPTTNIAEIILTSPAIKTISKHWSAVKLECTTQKNKSAFAANIRIKNNTFSIFFI